MIVRRALNWTVILKHTWQGLLYFAFISTLVYVLHDNLGYDVVHLSFAPIGALGSALAIFLAFRNNAAYDRWWEARKLWGSCVNFSRAWAGQLLTFPTLFQGDLSERAEIQDFKQELIYRHIAFVNALRLHLRKQFELVRDELSPFIDEEELRQVELADNKPNWLLQKQRERLNDAFHKKWLDSFHRLKLDDTLTEFNKVQGATERIKNTPMPRQYDYFTRVFLYLYCTLLPLGFIEALGVLTIPVSIVISFVFMALEKIGDRNEDPFENRITDTPMTALCKTIEINLREQLGEEELPSHVEAVDGFVF